MPAQALDRIGVVLAAKLEEIEDLLFAVEGSSLFEKGLKGFYPDLVRLCFKSSVEVF